MIFSIKKDKDEFLDKVYSDTIKEFNLFFELRWEYNQPPIIQIPNREIIDILWGTKTENWIVGWAEENKVFILDRENYEKESCHKYSEQQYIALIKHEIAHLYVEILSKKGFIPRWLNEGICIYVSGQNNFKAKPKTFKNFLEYFKKGGKGIYNEAGFVVELLINKYKKDKLIKLLNSLEKIKNKKDFIKIFSEIYNLPLNYESFNELLNESP